MTKQTAILAIDQGTTSSRAILFSTSGEPLQTRQKELPLTHPHKGWVEQNPEDIWNDTLWACQELIDYADNNNIEIACIGITNQRETTIIWDRTTGKPIYNAIVWQDRRTAEFCQDLKKKDLEPQITSKTGLLLDPYFSSTKIRWILDNVEGAQKKAKNGELAFGTIDSFLLWRLSKGKTHATDITNASRTMLFNIQTEEWDKDILQWLDIPKSLLPEVKENAHHFTTTDKTILGKEIPITGIAGDQQAATVGQACFETGMIKSTYGTGCFALMNIGDTFKQSKNKLLTTIAYKINGKTTYALEGSIFIAGAAIQWLRDNLKIIGDAAETEEIANSVPDNNGVYFVPAFTGLGAPYWNPDAKAAIMGLTRESNAAHIIRAALEAQSYQTLDLMEAFKTDSGIEPERIRADGGLINNKFVGQHLADMLNLPIDIPQITETTALGAAYLAGLQTGIYKDLNDITKNWSQRTEFKPHMPQDLRENNCKEWKKCVELVNQN